jgi:hypothetical protein
MKLNILKACRRSLRSAAAFTALVVLGGVTGVAQVQHPPYGTTWDCLMSGSGQQGIAFLTFSNDFTFSGYQLLVGKQSAAGISAPENELRNSGGEMGRYANVDTNSVGGGTNLFGFGPVSGPWRFDDKGRVVGFFTEILNQQTTITTNYETTVLTTPVYDTNTVPPTLIGFTYSTNYTTTFTTNTTATTNAVSFTAKVDPGKRLNLVSYTPYGKVTYKGVPQEHKPISAPISGSWFATKKENQQKILEFFNLFPTDVRNVYGTTNGQGPGFSFYGYAMVSVQKKAGFAFQTFQGTLTNFADASGGVLSATVGPISYPTKGAKANTKGFEEPITPINFQAQRQGP